jgi:hypothetical protein
MKKCFNILAMVALLALLSSCAEKAPERDCDIHSLLLDTSFLRSSSDKISDEYFESPVLEAPSESAGYSFYIERDASSDLVQNEIFRYKFVDDAIQMFDVRAKYFFRTDENSGPWKIPTDFLLQEIGADQYRAACGTIFFERRCTFVARYVEYYVFFEITVSKYGISEHDFSLGVNQLDEQLLACVGKP